MAEENAPAANENIKKKALSRLGIAAAVTAVALGGLWWLDQSGKDASKPAPPAPIVAAPAPIVEPVPAPAATDADIAAEPHEEPPVQAPPPPPQADIPAMTTRPAPTATTTSVPEPTAKAPVVAETKPILAEAKAPAGRGYVVQLGVFTNPANAQDLVERLRKQGIRAYTETRVHVGPFLNQAEAEKARAELRRQGISGVVGATR